MQAWLKKGVVVVLVSFLLLQSGLAQTAAQEKEAQMIAKAAASLRNDMLERRARLANQHFLLQFWDQSQIDQEVQDLTSGLLDDEFDPDGRRGNVVFKVIEDDVDGNDPCPFVVITSQGGDGVQTWVVSLRYDSGEWQLSTIRIRAPGF